MKRKRTDHILLWASFVSFFLMSVSFVLMPLEKVGMLPGILFWGGLIIGVLFQIVLTFRCKPRLRSYTAAHKEKRKLKMGLLTYGANKFAKIADNVLACSILGTILSFIFTKGFGYLCYVFMALMTFFFCLHCILNGKTYFCIVNQEKIRRMLEQKSKYHGKRRAKK